MEGASQKPVLHVAADQDLSDLIVRSIREHCGMKGCTYKEIHKLIHGMYTVEIADDVDLYRLIVISCKKSIKLGRLFKHGCKYRVSFNEFSIDPPSNGATLVGDKSVEKSTVFVCELCKENGEGRQAASLSVNITKDGAQSESVWTMDSSKKCCLCQSHTSSLDVGDISAADSSLLNSSIADTEVLSPAAVYSTSIPTKNALGNNDRSSTASVATTSISNDAGHVDFGEDCMSTSSLNKENHKTSYETADSVSKPAVQNQDSLQCNDVVKWDKNSGACSPDVAESGDRGRARKTKNRRTQVKFLTDGLTPFYSSDGKRKRPSLATGRSPIGSKPKKLRLSLDGAVREDSVQTAIGRAEGVSLQGSGSVNLPRLTVEPRRKKTWLYSSENHGTYQLERGVKEDILFPHITEDDVKMFELARSHAQQRQRQSRSTAPNSPCCQPEQAAVIFLCDEEEQRSKVQSSEEHRGACPGGVSSYDCVVAEEESLSRRLTSNGTDVVQAESKHPSDKPEFDIPCTGSTSLVDNAVDSLVENDDDDNAMDDDFADDMDDNIENSVCENKHERDCEINGTPDNRKCTENTFDSSFGNNNSLVTTADSTYDNNKGQDNNFGSIAEHTNITDTSDGTSVKAAQGNNGTSDDICDNANRTDSADDITCDNLSAFEKSEKQTASIKSGVANHDDVTGQVTATTENDRESGSATTNDHESPCANTEIANNSQGTDGASSLMQPSNTTQDGTSSLMQPLNTTRDGTGSFVQPSDTTRDGVGSLMQPSNTTRDGADSLMQPSDTRHINCSFAGNGTEANGNTVSGDGRNSVMKDAGLVPALTENVVQQRKAGNVFSEGLEMSFNRECTLEETPAAADNHTAETCVQQCSVSGGVSNSLDAVQQANMQAATSEALTEHGQSAVRENCTSVEDSAVMDNRETLKEKEIDKNCGSELAVPSSFPAEVLCVSGCESLLCTAPPLQLNSSIVSTCNADLGAESADPGILSVPSQLEQMKSDHSSALSKDEHSENVASRVSSLLTTDILPKAVLDTSDKNGLPALDADLVALPSKRNRKRKRFFCPDGCCSLDSDSHCVTKKSEENPAKSKVGCPKSTKQKPSPQPAVTPKVPRPRGRPRKNPLPAPQEEPSQADALPQLTAPSFTEDVSITPISSNRMMNCCNEPEYSGEANKKSSAMPHSLDLNAVKVVQEEADTAECLPCTSVSDATVYRNRAEHDSSGDNDIANAFDSEDESLSPTCAMTQEVSASVASALAGILSIQTEDLGVETVEKNINQGDFVRTDIFKTNVPQCLGTDPQVGVNFQHCVVNVTQDGVPTVQGGVDEARVTECSVTSGVLVQGTEAHEKDVESSDTVVMGRFELKMCVEPARVFEKDVPSCKSVTSTVIEATNVLEKDVRSSSRSTEMATELSRVLEKDVQTCSVETDTLQSGMVVEAPRVLDQNAQSCSTRTESFEPEIGIAVTQVVEKDVQSCNIVTGSFESQLGLQDKHVVEKDNQCGNSVTDGLELELSDVIARKVVENDLHSFKAVPKQSETEFVEASVYHYLNSGHQLVTKNEQSRGLAVSNHLANHLTAEMMDRSKITGTERANITEQNLYQCTITEEGHIQNTDVLLGSNMGISNCHQRLVNGPDGRVLDTSLPSSDCHLQSATTSLLHDCYMPLNNLSTDCHIQVPVEFQVEADSQIQLTVLPPDNRVHVLSDSSEALMRLVNPSLADCHLQLNSLASDVCAISEHQFTHAPGANAIFSSQNNSFLQTCAAIPNQTTQPDSSVTFLNVSCAATAPMQMPTNASNSIGGNVQDGTWPIQPSNLLYALPLQAPAPLANFGLNFPSNLMYALPIQSMVTGMNFERSDPPPESGTTNAYNKSDSTTSNPSSSGPCPVHAQSARGLMPQLLGCQPYIIICPGSLPISSILQPLSESLGQILPYICSPTDPRHLSCHSSVLGNFVSPLQQYSWGLQTQNASAPAANVGQFAKISTERNPAVDLFAPIQSHTQQLVEIEQQSATLGACSSAHENQAFTSVNASQLIGDSLLSQQFVTTQNIPVPLGIRSNQADFSSVPIQVHSSGFIFPPGK